jgi:nitrous-oxide reductase
MADLIMERSQKIYNLEDNKHPYAKPDDDTKVVRGNEVHTHMTTIRSHFHQTTLKVLVGDKVYFHVTNLEQDFDVPQVTDLLC